MELLRAGRAFTLTGHAAGPPHLWFVLTDPDPSKVVAVRVVTTRPHTDKTVVLAPGDHLFIRHESSVDYGSATFLVVRKLESAFKTGRCHLQPDMSASLLGRVRQGLFASSRTTHAIVRYCREAFGR